MLYAVTYNIEAIIGPSGFLSSDRQKVLEHAVFMAKIALDHLDDAVNYADWMNLAGETSDPRILLGASDVDEVINMLEQISAELKSKGEGYIDFYEHHDLFELVEAHEIESSCSPELRTQIAVARKAYFGVIKEIANYWCED